MELNIQKQKSDAWHRAFTQKLTNWRKRGKVVDANMETMKQKFGKSGNSRVPNTSIQTRRERKSKENELSEEEVAEQTEMKETLITEMSKPTKTRNNRVLHDLTASTSPLRRLYISKENPHARLLVKEWPSLKIENIMIKELPMIVDGATGYSEFLARFQAILTPLVDLARERATRYPNNHPLCTMLAKIPFIEATDPDFDLDLHTVAAMVALPYILPSTTKKTTHAHKYILDISQADTSAEEIREAVGDRHQPFLQIFGDESQPAKIVLYADKTPVLVSSSITKGLYALVSLHYVLNIEYSLHVAASLNFLQAACFGLPAPKTTRVKELLQKFSVM